MSDILMQRLSEMPSSLNDAIRTMDMAKEEIERLLAAHDGLVLIVMRGSHREARDLARPRFVEMHPEEKGHAAKLARANQQQGTQANDGKRTSAQR